MKIGDLNVIPLYDGTYLGCAWDTFGHAISESRSDKARKGGVEAEWDPHRGLLNQDGSLEMTFGGFVVPLSDERVVLIDTGIGPVTYKGVTGGRLLDSLTAAGIRPDEITDVVLTHLHPDHIGYAAPYGEPIFTRAEYRCHSADWQHFVGTNEIVTDRVKGIEDRVNFWDHDTSIAPGIEVRPMPGHTPGTSVVTISSGAERAMLLGDAVHFPVELLDDEWAGLGDIDPDKAAQARAALARELESGDITVTGGHFPGLQFGRLFAGAAARRWTYLGA